MNWIQRHPRLFFAAVIVLGVAAVAAVLKLQGPAVEVAHAIAGPIQHSIVVSGRVEAPRRVESGSVITGRVEKVLVEEGAAVDAGQPLILLETSELRASLAQARAAEASAQARMAAVRELNFPQSTDAVAQAEAQFRFTEQEYRRTRDLHGKGFISEARLQDAEKQLAVAKSQLETARTLARAQGASGVQAREAAMRLREAVAARELAESKFAQTTIRASVPGTVLARSVEPGDIASPGKRLLTLDSAGETRLSAQIDEKNLFYLKIGQQALVSSEAFPGQTFKATLYYVSPGVDVTRGSVEARLRVPEPPRYLRADMTVSIDIGVARKERALTVPAEAVRESGGVRSVQVVRDGRVESARVETGVRTSARVEITSGIGEGESVLLTRGIADGSRVRPGEVTR
ncbi:MAG: efflux RND transporter periplasmic adaptor subunit [Betaproteobacteria bacterium]|nr:efflux RND transporter periplasmic adaptor subunit [Betaproteobacteria bacterium]